jgi:hypothetical protein
MTKEMDLEYPPGYEPGTWKQSPTSFHAAADATPMFKNAAPPSIPVPMFKSSKPKYQLELPVTVAANESSKLGRTVGATIRNVPSATVFGGFGLFKQVRNNGTRKRPQGFTPENIAIPPDYPLKI